MSDASLGTFRTRHRWAPPKLASRVPATVLLLVAVVLIVKTSTIRRGEAALLAAELRSFGLQEQRAGSVVFFDGKHGTIGVDLTFGCSVGPLIALFVLCAAGLCWFRPAPGRATALAVFVLAAAFVLVNQLRLLVIVLAIMRWGIGEGYEVSHVLVGSLITTIGFVAGVYAFARLLSRARTRAVA